MLPKRSRKPNSQRAYFFLQESELLSANPIQFKSLKLAVKIVLFLFVLLERMILFFFFFPQMRAIQEASTLSMISQFISPASPSDSQVQILGKFLSFSLLQCTRLYQDHDKQKSSMRQFEQAVIKQKQSKQASVVERRKYKQKINGSSITLN